jgi:hypothetical protein
LTIDERIEALTMNLEIATKDIEQLRDPQLRTVRTSARWQGRRSWISAMRAQLKGDPDAPRP